MKLSLFSKEILRKLVHLVELPIIVLYSMLAVSVSPRFGLLVLTGLLLLLLEFEYIRIDYRPELTRRFLRLFGRLLLRRHERNNITGSIYFVTSTIICFAVFDYPIALLALLMTVFGDLVSALVGMRFGAVKLFRKKSVAGTLAGLFANGLVGFIVVPEFAIVYAPMAITASLVEAFTQKLDDNLTVPLFSGFVGQGMLYWLGVELPPLYGLL